MKTLFRAIITGAIIWIIGVSLYSISFYIRLLDNSELQANLILSIAVVPLVWYGARAYYKRNRNKHGLRIGLTFFFTAAVLDALITVPYLIIPNGGTYFDFFLDINFWLIGLEFIAVTLLYWYRYISLTKVTD